MISNYKKHKLLISFERKKHACKKHVTRAMRVPLPAIFLCGAKKALSTMHPGPKRVRKHINGMCAGGEAASPARVN
jgi:hypothetical protein